MHFAAEYFRYSAVLFQSVRKALRAVIISLLTSILCLGFFHFFPCICNRCLYQFSVFVKHPDSVLNHHDTFPEILYARSGNDSFLLMGCRFQRKVLISFCSRRLYDDVSVCIQYAQWRLQRCLSKGAIDKIEISWKE